MTELREKLNNIVEEKQTKIIPENLKVGVEAFGVQGTFTSDATATAADIRKGTSAYGATGVRLDGTLVPLDTSDATAKASDIRKGETAYSTEGVKLTGTLDPIDTSDATAIARDLAKGKTAYVNGKKITGEAIEYATDGNLMSYSLWGSAMKHPTDDPTNRYMTFYTRFYNNDKILRWDYNHGMAISYTSLKNALGLTADKIAAGEKILDLIGTYKGLDTSDATATAGDIAEGKTAYVNGEKVTGTMEVNDNNSKMNTAFSSGMNGSYKYSQIYQLVRTIPDNATINASTTSAVNMFYGCSALRDIPVLNASHIKDMHNMFYGCSYLTDESLNNILLMCANATSYTATKTLKYLGLDESQSNKCKAFTNYQAFLDAGWQTGY